MTDPNQIGKPRRETAWALLPDLLIVDGGKGQLAMAVEILEQFDLQDEVPVVGLAKREEELFLPNNPVSVLFGSAFTGFVSGAARTR